MKRYRASVLENVESVRVPLLCFIVIAYDASMSIGIETVAALEQAFFFIFVYFYIIFVCRPASSLFSFRSVSGSHSKRATFEKCKLFSDKVALVLCRHSN